MTVLSFSTRKEASPLFNEDIYGCLVGVDRFWRLDIKPGSSVARSIDTPSIALHAPWVGYGLGRYFTDTSTIWALARNLRTGELTQCKVSGNYGWMPGTLPEVRVRPDGVVAFSAEEAELPRPAYGFGREIGFCRGDELTVLDQGLGIAPHSLTLRGSTLKWKNSGRLHSALVP